MADRIVTLNYVDGNFTAEPSEITVRKGHTISFRLGKSPENSTIKIKIRNPQAFSKAEFHTGDADIEVIEDLSERTIYDCEVIIEGARALPKNEAGGGIGPATKQKSSP